MADQMDPDELRQIEELDGVPPPEDPDPGSVATDRGQTIASDADEGDVEA